MTETAFAPLINIKRKKFQFSAFIKTHLFRNNLDRFYLLFDISRPHAKFYGVCARSSGIAIQSTQLSLPDSVDVYPYIIITTTKKAKDAFMIMASVAIPIDDAIPDIQIRESKDSWLIDISKDEKKLKLKIFDRNELPEFEVLKCQYK